MFTGDIFQLGKILQQERLAEAEQNRRMHVGTSRRPGSLMNRTAHRLGDLLVSAGEQLKRV